jgi:hypothetical protein
MRKIKRGELFSFYEYSHYIMDKNPLVKDVYSNSIYFDKTNSCCNMSWGPWCEGQISRDVEDMVLRAINGLCNTEFVFED